MDASHRQRPRSPLNATVDTWQQHTCTLWPEHGIDLNTVVICQWQGLTVVGHLANKKKTTKFDLSNRCGGSEILSKVM